jgi:hypothetical protein
MCKEMMVILVNRVVDKKKMEGQGGAEAQGVADKKSFEFVRLPKNVARVSKTKLCF